MGEAGVLPDVASVTVRLLVAVLAGGAIGINRELQHKPAGLRTHALVALGAATVIVVTQGMQLTPDANATSRVIQGIITGIGFLGAGVILHPSGQSSVRGLTTAATIWIAAGLGTACGTGLWPVAAVATILAVFVLLAGQWFERWIHRAAERFRSSGDGRASR